jgi:hypothetical protein
MSVEIDMDSKLQQTNKPVTLAAGRTEAPELERTQAFPPPTLPLACYLLTFRAADPIQLPPFAGSLWRSVLGRALKRIADGIDPAPREFDAARARALYRELFETPPPPDSAKMRRYSFVPHPYVIAAPFSEQDLRLRRGAETTLGLTLIGRANETLGVILAGFRRAAEAGIGKSRGRMVLEGVDAALHTIERLHPVYRAGRPVMPVPAKAPPIPPMPRYLAVTLGSPLRLERQIPEQRPTEPASSQFAGTTAIRHRHPRKKVILPEEFEARHLLSALVRRISMLSYFHAEPHEPDFKELKAIIERARLIDRDLAWYDQTRWSATRQEKEPSGGIVGTFLLDMAELEPLYPYLWLGQWVHVGKGTVMGMGALRLTPLD